MTTLSPMGAERIHLRLRKEAKALLERAASHEGKSISAFILGHILPKAEETVQTHEVMRIRGDDAKALLQALENPPPPNAALQSAIAAHERLIGDL